MSKCGNIRCCRCNNRLSSPGAHIISPPHPDDLFTRVLHICKPCFDVIQKEIDSHEKSNTGLVPKLIEPDFDGYPKLVDSASESS